MPRSKKFADRDHVEHVDLDCEQADYGVLGGMGSNERSSRLV